MINVHYSQVESQSRSEHSVSFMASRFGVIFLEGGFKPAKSLRIAFSSPEKQTYQPSWGFSVVAKRKKKSYSLAIVPNQK